MSNLNMIQALSLLIGSNSFLLIIIIYLFHNSSNTGHLNVSRSESKPCKKTQYVFFDLGLNNGDSIRNFLGMMASSQGGNINQMIDPNIIKNNEWTIYGFEANPYFDEMLQGLKKEIDAKHTFYLYNSTAAWIHDGFVEFFIDTYNVQGGYWGSSIKIHHPDVVRSGKKSVKLPCLEIAEILKKYDQDDFVVMKIDIEGAEYALLTHFLEKDVFKLVDYMAVEYHTGLSPFKSGNGLFNKIMRMNKVKFLKWN